MIDDKLNDGLSYIRGFEEKIGIAQGFFESLYHEDDWSFVIKLHALLEAACADILVAALGKPELKKSFSRIPLSDSDYGKAPMIGSLNLLSKPYINFIRKMSELRNDAVHNVANTNLNLKLKVESLDKQQKKSWAKALAVAVNGNEQEKIYLLIDNPKGVIWLSALCLMTQIALHKLIIDSDDEVACLEKQAFKALDEMFS